MKTKASIVVMSHLSDAQNTTTILNSIVVMSHINFAKFIIIKTNGDLNQEIDPDDLWEKWLNK